MHYLMTVEWYVENSLLVPAKYGMCVFVGSASFYNFVVHTAALYSPPGDVIVM